MTSSVLSWLYCRQFSRVFNCWSVIQWRLYLRCCHGERALCLVQHPSHWRQNRSQMSSHWSAWHTPAITLLWMDRKRSRIRQTADTFYIWAASRRHSHHSHHSQGEPVPQGRWVFPPHTDIPVKLCEGPDLASRDEKRSLAAYKGKYTPMLLLFLL